MQVASLVLYLHELILEKFFFLSLVWQEHGELKDFRRYVVMTDKNDIKKLSAEIFAKVKKCAQPPFVAPMLATLTKKYFSNNEWYYEHKFDGERCLAFKKNGLVTLFSRNRKRINAIYPELVTALKKQVADNFIIDGEIVSVNKKELSDFELLQGRINVRHDSKLRSRAQQIAVSYYIFDLMYVDGYDIRKLPLSMRKKLLKKLLRYNTKLTYTEHTAKHGIKLFKKACKTGWEGVIAKNALSQYVGRRSSEWLKFKCIMKQELVIAGYTKPKGSRTYFGALLVGYYQNGKLKYAGKVGTGYSRETLAFLDKKLRKLVTKKCPFTDYDDTTKDIVWVKPNTVAEFQFAQWTKAGRLRVGRYKGLRDDKKAKDVVKEVPTIIGPDDDNPR